MDCQRLYTIVGSALFHKKYLLTSHLPAEDLVQINTFLRRNGTLNLLHSEQVKSLVIWKRIYPASRKQIDAIRTPDPNIPNDDKRYLLAVGYGHNLLTVVLESGGCTTP